MTLTTLLKNNALLIILTVCCLDVQASVRQRYYNHGTQTEFILHWNPEEQKKIHLSEFSGTVGAGSTSSTLDQNSVLELAKTTLNRWLNPTQTVWTPGVSFDLNQGYPYLTENNCEYTLDGVGNLALDGLNNFLFTTRINSQCAEAVPTGQGIIALTKVRVASLGTGRILEADIQFNDVDFMFVSGTTAHNLGATPPVVNLEHVMVHEFGHFLGLDHTPIRNAAMLFAVSENMKNVDRDDQLGVLSLYPTAESQTQFAQLNASVTRNGVGLFGVPLLLLDATTLDVVLSEMSDPNGRHQICAAPAGNYVAFARSYKPKAAVHSYYSVGSQSGSCLNMSCGALDENVNFSFWSQTPSEGQGGVALKVLKLDAGIKHSALNIQANTTAPQLTAPPSDDPLSSAEPRVLRFGESAIPLNANVVGDAVLGTTLGTQHFLVEPSAAQIRISTAALKLLGRVHLSLSFYEQDDDSKTLPTSCVSQVAVLLTGQDPWIECSTLDHSKNYILEVTGRGVHCRAIPGNDSNCASVGAGELVSHNLSLYMLSYTESGAGAQPFVHSKLDKNLDAALLYDNIPACDSKSNAVQTEEREPASEPGGCCGFIQNPAGGPPWSGLLSGLLMLGLSVIFVNSRRRRPVLLHSDF